MGFSVQKRFPRLGRRRNLVEKAVPKARSSAKLGGRSGSQGSVVGQVCKSRSPKRFKKSEEIQTLEPCFEKNFMCERPRTVTGMRASRCGGWRSGQSISPTPSRVLAPAAEALRFAAPGKASHERRRER